MSSIKQTILDFIRDEYLDEDQTLDSSTQLISSGIVDSFSMVSLKSFLENRYRIFIPNRMGTPEAFDTVERIESLLRKLGVTE